MTIGEKIRQLRKDKGLTQDAIASALEISRQAIAKWESNQSSPSTENLVKLAALFDVSLEELVDVKQYQTPALEEYALLKLDKEQQKDKAIAVACKYAKAGAVIAISYFVVYGISFLVFHMAGIENCIWNWMQQRHVLLITCLFSMAAIFLNRRIASTSFLLGTVLAILGANYAGTIAMHNSPISYNNGWVIYLALLFIVSITGYLVDLKVSNPELSSMQKSRRLANTAFIIALAVVFASGVLLSVRHIKYGIGAERGYKAGYAIGAAEAESGKPMNQNFLTKYFPEEYRFGTTEFKGYAVYWPEGYKNGYQSAKE